MSGNTVRETLIVKDDNDKLRVLYITNNGKYFIASHIVGQVEEISSIETHSLKIKT